MYVCVSDTSPPNETPRDSRPFGRNLPFLQVTFLSEPRRPLSSEDLRDLVVPERGVNDKEKGEKEDNQIFSNFLY